ncbi:ABC transporter ATP-binding protein [Paenibacillus sp. L3-i20]|uniref:ABC transporter ATP-binding protein n=1 Tax=Paenibacillus sp. L3-i20 TaxID=2905833 RepID=UPI001EDECA65|nr:ABC transporter ATP-binding protein [Paenibacillus sp. L3-i20]GKU76394.1 bacitracin ABC transporter ATP-binding protein [Paenibacillus sp. L3-i20]
MSAQYLLEAQGINVNIKKHSILKNVNLSLKGGKIYGLLGPNGAGKTTLLKVLLGINRPITGKVLFNQHNLYENPNKDVLKTIGSIIEYPGFYENLTLYENLDLHLRYQGKSASQNEINELLGSVGLFSDRSKLFSQTSLGMKQRLGIARSMSHKPKLLLLDEPTNGLDPQGIKEIRETLISEVISRGTTVIISSHILSEINLMADELIMMNKGEIIFETNNMKKHHPMFLYRGKVLTTFQKAKLEAISDHIYMDDNGVIEFISTLTKDEFTQYAATHELQLENVEAFELPLEDLYMKLISRSTQS